MANIAALFVAKNGVYTDVAGVDAWHVERDATKYRGDCPVIAHPPCARWCQLAWLVQARYGYKVGDDGGLFKFALETVRRVGGILEHPAHSLAWSTFFLPKPPKTGWSDVDTQGGRSCLVYQQHYGHRARKATWLYAILRKYPELRWGKPAQEPTCYASTLRNKSKTDRKNMSKKERSATPVEFRDALIASVRLGMTVEHG